MFDRMLTLSIHGELISRTGRRLAGPRPFILDVSPDTDGYGLFVTQSQHFERGVVGKQGSTILNTLCDGLSQWFQQSSGLTGLLSGPMGEVAVSIAGGKASLGAVEAFTRGVLSNALVCLAVWLTFAARTVTGKILAILWPISCFVLLGLEHSVANMYFLPQGILAGSEAPIASMVANLVWVTLGNILGGAGGVALAYQFAYLKRKTPAN